MSGFNGSGTFNISGIGLPYVSATTISSTVANTLNNDLATGLSNCITKDGQQVIQANIPWSNYKITGLGSGSSANDAANLLNVQASTTQYLTVTGTNTIVGTPSIALPVYSAGNTFRFVAAGNNTGATTLNISALGAKSVVKNGSTALASGDLVSGRMYVVVYDGTNFQLINQSSFTSLTATDITTTTLTVTDSAAITNDLGVGGDLTVGGSVSAVTNITLNTTLSPWSATYNAFEISNRAGFIGSSSATYVANNAYNDGTWRYIETAGASLIDQNLGSTTVYAAASGSTGTPITWTTALTVSNAGVVTTTTPATGTNTTQVATTAFTQNQIAASILGGSTQAYASGTWTSAGSPYTNSTGRPLFWVIKSAGASATYVGIGGVSVGSIGVTTVSTTVYTSFVIPIGATYTVAPSSTGSVSGWLLG